jgi:hypothetical protein
MPTSLDPPPADNELECGRCGAYFYYELTRCPKCGATVYEPDDETNQLGPGHSASPLSPWRKLGRQLDRLFHQVTGKPYPADELFEASINQARLFNDLLTKVGGDRTAVERLIAYERSQLPQGNRTLWLERAIQRWARDNRAPGPR